MKDAILLLETKSGVSIVVCSDKMNDLYLLAVEIRKSGIYNNKEIHRGVMGRVDPNHTFVCEGQGPSGEPTETSEPKRPRGRPHKEQE